MPPQHLSSAGAVVDVVVHVAVDVDVADVDVDVDVADVVIP